MQSLYQYGTPENRSFLQEMQKELLSFGHHFPSPSGAAYYLGDDGAPWTDRPRETWITSRMAHVYSIGAMLDIPGSADLAKAAIHGLIFELRDKAHGGWYAGVTPEGAPIPQKQCYAHAFVILAASSGVLARIPGADQLLAEALRIYNKYFWDEKNNLAYDAWDTSFTTLDPYRGLNANMHSVEAFLAVADATGQEAYRLRAGKIIDRVILWASRNGWRIPEHFTAVWEPDLSCNQDRPDDPFKPYGATPGHGIEWARLIVQWTLSTFREKTTNAAYYLDAAEQLYTQAISDGWAADGAPGIVYTTDWNGAPVVHDRMHWTLAEAINTAALLYQITKKAKYADDYAMFMAYLDTTVRDHENGSWYHQLDAENQLLGTVWPGKSDLYHAFQATLIPYLPPETSIASAIYRRELRVVAMGELLIDFTASEDSAAGNPQFEANPGGAPCNVLAMLQKCGRKTAFIGKVGHDQFGTQLRDTIREIGIDDRYLLEDASIPTTLAFVHRLPDGDRSFSFYRNPGADMMLTEKDILPHMFIGGKIFHFGTLSMTHEGVRKATQKAIKLAKQAGMLISLDPNLREPLWDSLEDARGQMRLAISHCDILKISDNEVEFLTGETDYDAGIRKIQEAFHTPLILLTLGKDGSRAYYKDIRVEVPGFPQEHVVDTTGAGDTFCGCVLSFLCDTGLENLTAAQLTEMLTFANAAASIITTRKGAIRSMPNLDEVHSMISQA